MSVFGLAFLCRSLTFGRAKERIELLLFGRTGARIFLHLHTLFARRYRHCLLDAKMSVSAGGRDVQLQLFDLVPNPSAEAVQNATLRRSAALFTAHCRVAKSLSVHTLRAYEGDLGLFIKDVGPDAVPAEIDRDRLWQHSPSTPVGREAS